METRTSIAAALMISLSFALAPAQAADLPGRKAPVACSAYYKVPFTVAIRNGRASILAQSSFYRPNRFRSGMGPHHYALHFDPLRACAPPRAAVR